MKHSIPCLFSAHRTLALFFLAWICGGFNANGQGAAFTYQGQLTRDGSPADGQYDFTFSLFGASSGGTPMLTPVTTNTVVTNGLFTVTLDFGAGVFGGGGGE